MFCPVAEWETRPEGIWLESFESDRRTVMEHLDVFFMMVGVLYSTYVVVSALLKLDYQVKRRRRRAVKAR